ncbi:MAG: pirin family protein, partial [Marinosulfonomonas sp.]|nr:pirin family protein [Marinosulfonomonas sp.]
GAPIQEPVAWHGPIVMNTTEELIEAFDDLRNDRFIQPANQ